MTKKTSITAIYVNGKYMRKILYTIVRYRGVMRKTSQHTVVFDSATPLKNYLVTGAVEAVRATNQKGVWHD